MHPIAGLARLQQKGIVPPSLNTNKGPRVLVFRVVWDAPDQGVAGVTQLSYRQAKRPRVQAASPYHTIPPLFADARLDNAYSAIVKVKLFVCIGEMISFRYGTRIPANLAQ